MTYQKYYNQLIREIDISEKDLLKQHKLLKGEKGYLDHNDLYIYMGLCNNLYSLLAKCDEVLKLITGGVINPHDEIDPVYLPGGPEN